jgi:hypothetical protein
MINFAANAWVSYLPQAVFEIGEDEKPEYIMAADRKSSR